MWQSAYSAERPDIQLARGAGDVELAPCVVRILVSNTGEAPCACRVHFDGNVRDAVINQRADGRVRQRVGDVKCGNCGVVSVEIKVARGGGVLWTGIIVGFGGRIQIGVRGSALLFGSRVRQVRAVMEEITIGGVAVRVLLPF